MLDSIRHPECLEMTGFRLKLPRCRSGTGMTTFLETGGVWTDSRLKNFLGHGLKQFNGFQKPKSEFRDIANISQYHNLILSGRIISAFFKSDYFEMVYCLILR